MRNKVVALLLLVFIVFIAAIATEGFGLAGVKKPVETSLIESMNSTNARVLESTISAWGKIQDGFMTEKQIEEEIYALLDIIKPEKSTIKLTKESNEEQNKQTMCGSIGSKFYNVVVESLHNEKGAETYVIIDVSMDRSSKELLTERQKLEQYFEARNSKPNLSSCIIGVYDGRLSENDMRSKIATAMSSVKAKQVEGLHSDEINSISAFSGNINSFVLSNNKKINMQIAMRYSSYDDKTYIWIGSPLIHVEY